MVVHSIEDFVLFIQERRLYSDQILRQSIKQICVCVSRLAILREKYIFLNSFVSRTNGSLSVICPHKKNILNPQKGIGKIIVYIINVLHLTKYWFGTCHILPNL